jgi:hypothetical protein
MRSARKEAISSLIPSSAALSILFMVTWTMVFVQTSHRLHSTLAFRPNYLNSSIKMVIDSKSLQKQLKARVDRYHSSEVNSFSNSNTNKRNSYGTSSPSFAERKELRWSEYLSLPKDVERYVICWRSPCCTRHGAISVD